METITWITLMLVALVVGAGFQKYTSRKKMEKLKTILEVSPRSYEVEVAKNTLEEVEKYKSGVIGLDKLLKNLNSNRMNSLEIESFRQDFEYKLGVSFAQARAVGLLQFLNYLTKDIDRDKITEKEIEQIKEVIKSVFEFKMSNYTNDK